MNTLFELHIQLHILLHELYPFVSLQKDELSQAQVGMWYIYTVEPHLMDAPEQQLSKIFQPLWS